MKEQRHDAEYPPGSQEREGGKGGSGAVAGPASDKQVSQTGEPVTPKKLTAEEQMALYEEKLKEEDWGHQPC